MNLTENKEVLFVIGKLYYNVRSGCVNTLTNIQIIGNRRNCLKLIFKQYGNAGIFETYNFLNVSLQSEDDLKAIRLYSKIYIPVHLDELFNSNDHVVFLSLGYRNTWTSNMNKTISPQHDPLKLEHFKFSENFATVLDAVNGYTPQDTVSLHFNKSFKGKEKFGNQFFISKYAVAIIDENRLSIDENRLSRWQNVITSPYADDILDELSELAENPLPSPNHKPLELTLKSQEKYPNDYENEKKGNSTSVSELQVNRNKKLLII